MRGKLIFVAASLWLAGIGLSGCGGSASPAVKAVMPQPADLAGNWLLLGALPTGRAEVTPPNAAMSFDVSGDVVTAAGEFTLPCSSGMGSFGFGFGAGLTGTITTDGSFTVNSPPAPTGITVPTLTLQGTAPSGAGQPWSGTYTASGGTASCSVGGTGSFEATSIGDVTGAYTASGTGVFHPHGSVNPANAPLTVQMQVQQGGPLYGLGKVLTPFSRLAVDGTIAVQGISCFSTGTSGADAQSLALGSAVQLGFGMDDGSTMILTGDVLTPDASQLGILGVTVAGGQCAGTYLFGVSPLLMTR